MGWRLAILSEAYSYITYKERIQATKDFVSECFDYIHENADAVVQLLDAVDDELVRAAQSEPERISLSLNARVDKFDEKYTIKAFDGDEPADFEVDFYGKYSPTRSTPCEH